jgi:hypothetical protein
MATSSGNTFLASANAGKALSRDPKDPRGYFKTLTGLGGVSLEIAGAVLLKLADSLVRSTGRPIAILDIGCSYGILAAVMRCGLSIEELRGRYARSPFQALSSDALAHYDSHYFASWSPRDDLRFIGLDSSPDAIAYAQGVGLIEEGLVVDLETNSPSERARSVIRSVDLVVSTAVTGDVTETTFTRILQVFPPGNAPWVASFARRLVDYSRIADAARQYGLATERLASVDFLQRGFRDKMEAGDASHLLKARGVDPAGRETEGCYHADLFVSRPAADVQRRGLREIVSPASSSISERN